MLQKENVDGLGTYVNPVMNNLVGKTDFVVKCSQPPFQVLETEIIEGIIDPFATQTHHVSTKKSRPLALTLHQPG